MRIIACIEDPDVIEKILAHLDAQRAESEATLRPPSRASPQRGLFDETGLPHHDLVWAVPSAAPQRRRLSRKPAGGGEVRRRGRHRGEFEGVTPIHMPVRRAGAACRRQVSTPIRRDSRREPPKRRFIAPIRHAPVMNLDTLPTATSIRRCITGGPASMGFGSNALVCGLKSCNASGTMPQ
jgi:hypothetical protein